MATEIERKFLVRSLDFVVDAIKVYQIEQAYLSGDTPTVRLRIRDDEAYLTVKGKSSADGLRRSEWEYSIPLQDAVEMLPLCMGRLTKKRYVVPHDRHMWEVDVFEGKHDGLVIAEVELSDETEAINLPPWVGEEVTGRAEYYNSNLSRK